MEDGKVMHWNDGVLSAEAWGRLERIQARAEDVLAAEMTAARAEDYSPAADAALTMFALTMWTGFACEVLACKIAVSDSRRVLEQFASKCAEWTFDHKHPMRYAADSDHWKGRFLTIADQIAESEPWREVQGALGDRAAGGSGADGLRAAEKILHQLIAASPLVGIGAAAKHTKRVEKVKRIARERQQSAEALAVTLGVSRATWFRYVNDRSSLQEQTGKTLDAAIDGLSE